jgi:hypothetical protein
VYHNDIGWVPKHNIRGLDHKIYIMDFFGSQKLRGSGLDIPPSRFLTAYGSPWNPFLGYYIKPTTANEINSPTKKTQGVIWGKDMKHFDGRHELINTASSLAPLIATIQSPAGGYHGYSNVRWIGHQTKDSWLELLSESKFLLGLGNPLLGPSAIDAVSAGCMYLNPIYEQPMREIYASQHVYAAEKIGEPYVCSFHINRKEELEACVKKALSTTLQPHIPTAFTQAAYYQRVAQIFQLD